MEFDWFTFVAQIINFTILLLLLRRFLFKPISQAMHERESQIAARFEEAAVQTQQAEEEASRLRAEQQALAQDKAELLAKAKAEAESQRRQMIQDARTEAEAMEEDWRAAIEHERALFLQLLRQRASQQVFEIVRRALMDLAHVDLEEQMIQVFLHRLQKMTRTERTSLAEAVQKAQQPIVIRSTFKLPETERQQIQHLLSEILATPIDTDFERVQDLLCGIELQIYGHRIAWSLRDYLMDLENHLTELFEMSGNSSESRRHDVTQKPGGKDMILEEVLLS